MKDKERHLRAGHIVLKYSDGVVECETCLNRQRQKSMRQYVGHRNRDDWQYVTDEQLDTVPRRP